MRQPSRKWPVAGARRNRRVHSWRGCWISVLGFLCTSVIVCGDRSFFYLVGNLVSVVLDTLENRGMAHSKDNRFVQAPFCVLSLSSLFDDPNDHRVRSYWQPAAMWHHTQRTLMAPNGPFTDIPAMEPQSISDPTKSDSKWFTWHHVAWFRSQVGFTCPITVISFSYGQRTDPPFYLLLHAAFAG